MGKGVLKATVETYKPVEGRNLSFLLVGDKILVKTAFQMFIVKYDHYNYRKQYENLRELIKLNKIKTMAELMIYCDLRPGPKYQMYGLELVQTREEWHL